MRRWLVPLVLAAAAGRAGAAAPAAQAGFDTLIDQAKAVMMEDPRQALARARRAEALAAAIPGSRPSAFAAARARWLQGEALSRLGDGGAALPVLQGALAAVERVAPGDALHGDILLSRGWVEETRGRIAAGLADFQRGFQIYRAAGDARGEAKALQNIAGIYQDAGDAERALRYYTQVTEVYRGDPAFALAAYNNLGEILRATGRYAAAEKQYRLALAAARQEGSPLLEANILTNLASARLMRGDPAGADRLARRALALTAHTTSDERHFVWGVFAQIAAARGDTAAAAVLIGRAFAGVDPARSTLPYRDFHQLAADIYAREGRDDLALAHLRAWKRLDDAVRAVAVSTNAALMAAQFDFSTQNLRIVQLQANRARLHETILVVAVAAVSLISGLMLIGLLSLRRSRNQTRAANAQLVKALQAKTDFLAMTSHEIRTPLNGILGMTQVLLADRALAEPTRARLQVVHGAGETMRLLVDDILELSKMETGNLAVERAPVRLKPLIEDAAGLWRGKAETKRLALTLDLDGCPDLVEEDGGRLRQILLNLLSNAVKFTEAGTVALRAAAQGGRLVISVADTGIGIAPDHQELIFEKFQQADTSTSRRFGGTGLGLAICRNLATAMEGSVTVASTLGAGATFTLDLPLRLVDAPQAVAEEAGPAAPILLFEPNALTRRMLAKTLAGGGRDVEVAETAEDLLRALAAGPATSVLMQAAAATGRWDAILAAARARPARLVVLAGPDEDVAAAADAPEATVLRKPVAAEAILAALGRDGAERPFAVAA